MCKSSSHPTTGSPPRDPSSNSSEPRSKGGLDPGPRPAKRSTIREGGGKRLQAVVADGEKAKSEQRLRDKPLGSSVYLAVRGTSREQTIFPLPPRNKTVQPKTPRRRGNGNTPSRKNAIPPIVTDKHCPVWAQHPECWLSASVQDGATLSPTSPFLASSSSPPSLSEMNA